MGGLFCSIFFFFVLLYTLSRFLDSLNVTLNCWPDTEVHMSEERSWYKILNTLIWVTFSHYRALTVISLMSSRAWRSDDLESFYRVLPLRLQKVCPVLLLDAAREVACRLNSGHLLFQVKSHKVIFLFTVSVLLKMLELSINKISKAQCFCDNDANTILFIIKYHHNHSVGFTAVQSQTHLFTVIQNIQ